MAVTRDTDDDLRSRIVRAHTDLPRQQRLVADYFLDHLDEVPFLSVPALARRASVSEATVVRLAQRLGYEGFAELKADLLEIVRRRVVRGDDVHGRDGESPSPEDALDEVARQEIENLGATADQIDRTVFRGAVGALVEAGHVYTYGLGISAHLARLLAYLATQIGRRATHVPTELSTPREALVALGPTDALVVFSFPPYSRQTIDLTRSAVERGVATIAICDRPSAPVATLSRYSLSARSDNMMFSNSVAAASMLVNALVTELAMRERGASVEAVSEINRIFEDESDLLT